MQGAGKFIFEDVYKQHRRAESGSFYKGKYTSFSFDSFFSLDFLKHDNKVTTGTVGQQHK